MNAYSFLGILLASMFSLATQSHSEKELSAFVYTNTIILLKTCVDTLNSFHHILIVLNPEKAPLLCKKQKIQLLFLSTYIEAHTLTHLTMFRDKFLMLHHHSHLPIVFHK